MTFRIAEKTSTKIKSESSMADDKLHGPATANSWDMGMTNKTSETDKLRQKVDQMREKLEKLLKQNEAYHATSELGETGQDDTYQEGSGWPADPNDEDLRHAEGIDGCQNGNYEHLWTGEDEMPELENTDGDSGVGHEWAAEEDSWETGRLHDESGLGDEVALTEYEVDKLRYKVKSLQVKLALKVKELEGERDNSNPSRNYFLSRYKWQKLDRGLIDEWEHLAHTNIEVPSGDVLADSELYISGDRKDYDVFVDLYGIDPHAAPSVLKDKLTIELVNAHATTLVSKHRTCTPKFGELFARFIKNLQRTGYPRGYLFGFTEDVDILELRASYSDFRCALITEVCEQPAW
ncbi:hypothetical protein BDV38DRAFT_297485 [Aspergillus pseudotamarii]|uniref:Uncharacterized protein n=1 Tax=Aspergillus pseudotamarii TaxID=132259 RepID=A0A5N6SD81_ASPPS|nr:uncharacterized protein BDV38DRAFT_297485 [Aspergillus pseudotamarii]KAE8131819.1 hypothetical protein BDV38DRAFT_297485 [Aspergillus pseudotamarii]